jgi:hypothetical protein
MRWTKIVCMAVFAASLSGCGLLAAPCRVTSAVVKVVPVVGKTAALPLDACATVIDP